MKTPEEIKKGLERCGDITHCNTCENSFLCQIEEDALAYIQQLEDENASMQQVIRDAKQHIKSARQHAENMQELTNQLEANQPRWISVKEMFPKHKQVVLAYVDPCLEIVQWNEADELWEADNGWFKLDIFTHWMPIPSVEGIK